MTVLAPLFLAAAGAAALLVVAMHFLARRRPPAGVLPTARFVPERAVRATSRAPRPTDLALLALRVLVVLLAGAGFAGLAREPERRASARVILVDRSRAVGDAAALRDAAVARLREGDAVVLVDSAAVVVAPADAADSLRALAPTSARGVLTAGLLVAQREAARLAETADSVRIVLVSPLAMESLDSATAAVRLAWRGPVEVVRVGARAPLAAPRVAIDPGDDDPLAASVALLGLGAAAAEATVRIAREPAPARDSAWLAAAPGRVLVHWPRDGAPLPARAATDTVGAVAAEGAVVVAPFERRVDPRAGRVVARWVDGAPAAAERAAGAGCERDVAVPVAARGDLALRAEMLALVRALAAPCGGPIDAAIAPDSLVARIVAGDARLDRPTPAPVPAARAEARSTLAPWLLGAALLLALVEPLLRRPRERETSS
jgi:hypothetical protein